MITRGLGSSSLITRGLGGGIIEHFYREIISGISKLCYIITGQSKINPTVSGTSKIDLEDDI